MSIARLALRKCAVEALKGQTFVGANVKDSDIGAIDIAGSGELRTSADAPFILIYTDESAAEDVKPRDLRQTGGLDFVAEFGVTAAMAETDEETGESRLVGVGLAATDENLEMILDLIDRQIVNTLTDPGNAWAEIWRDLSDGIEKIERKRAVDDANGHRLAFRQLRMRLRVKPDPVFGAPLAPASVWMKFKAAADADLPDVAPILAIMLGELADEVTYEALRRLRGDTAGAAARLGYPPQYAEHEDATIQTWDVANEADQ